MAAEEASDKEPQLWLCWMALHIYEPTHDKTNKMTVFAVRMKKAWVLSYPMSALRRLWSDWADAQADLNLHWAHSHFVGFVVRWLIWRITNCMTLRSHFSWHGSIVCFFFSWVPKLTLQEAISVFIIWERSRSSLSPWQPYLSSLPKRFTTPGYFSDTELSLLPVSVYSKCVMEVNKIKESYRKISEYCKSEWTAFHQLLTLDVFTWAWYVINTRSVYYKRPTCKFLSPDEEDHLALAPFLDLLNHSATANVSIRDQWSHA